MQTVSVRLDKTQKKKIQSKHAKAANSQTGGHVSTKHSICKYKIHSIRFTIQHVSSNRQLETAKLILEGTKW